MPAIAALLLGCAGQPPAPRVEKVYIEVPVERARAIPPAPAWATDALPLGQPIDAQIAALLAERRQARAYIEQLLGVCR